MHSDGARDAVGPGRRDGHAAGAAPTETGPPPGPGRALVLAVDPRLRQQLTDIGWQVTVVPIPAGDLTGFALAAAEASADLVAVDTALTPLHHADKRAALAVVLRWLRPGGLLWLREPLEPGWGRGGLRRAWQRLLHGRLDPHSGAATVQFWQDACQHAGFDQIEVTETSDTLTLRALRRHG